MLGHAAVDYFRACVLARDYARRDGDPLFAFVLPTMHHTIELLSKAIACKAVANFNPKSWSHRTLVQMREHATIISSFDAILQFEDNVQLINELEKSYLGVRYGECVQIFDGDSWDRFVTVCALLFADLSSRTGLRFPYGPVCGLIST